MKRLEGASPLNKCRTDLKAGLAAFDLSRATPFQQSLLFIQMFFGSPVVVSWIVVLVRK
jgi:hypothetical protein